jgi:hypothetical protein
MENLTINSTSITVKYDILSVILGFYVQTVMTYAGALLNFICILIFIEIVRYEHSNQGNLYKYLLVKSILDCLFCVQTIPQMFYYRADFSTNKSRGMQYWFKYNFYYFYPVLSLASVWFEVAASIDCLLLIARKFQWHKTLFCFWSVTVSLIVACLIFYIPTLFWFEIERYEDGGYYSKVTKFGLTRLMTYHYVLIHSILRDIIPAIISIFLNSMIVYYIREVKVRRQNMEIQHSVTINHQTSTMVKKAQKAEKNKIKMIFFTSFTHFFHLPGIIYNMNLFNVRSNNFLTQLCILSVSFSYFVPIVSYSAFNKNFSKYIKRICFCLAFRRR